MQQEARGTPAPLCSPPFASRACCCDALARDDPFLTVPTHAVECPSHPVPRGAAEAHLGSKASTYVHPSLVEQ